MAPASAVIPVAFTHFSHYAYAQDISTEYQAQPHCGCYEWIISFPRMTEPCVIEQVLCDTSESLFFCIAMRHVKLQTLLICSLAFVKQRKQQCLFYYAPTVETSRPFLVHPVPLLQNKLIIYILKKNGFVLICTRTLYWKQ